MWIRNLEDMNIAVNLTKWSYSYNQTLTARYARTNLEVDPALAVTNQCIEPYACATVKPVEFMTTALLNSKQW